MIVVGSYVDDAREAYDNEPVSPSATDDLTADEWEKRWISEQPGVKLIWDLAELAITSALFTLLIRQVWRVRAIDPTFASHPYCCFTSQLMSDIFTVLCCPSCVGCWVSRALIHKEENDAGIDAGMNV